MSHLSKLALSKTSQKEPVSPIARKRLNLLRKLEVQIDAAEAELRDEEFLEDIRKWVRGEDGERRQITEQRKVRKWWWQHHTGAWMITLRDGAKELPLGEGQASIEVGEMANLVDTLETIKSAVLAGEIDPALQAMVKTKPKTPAGKSKI
ncbi:DUF6641 family protein [Pelagimonas varians]|uniref:Uncharacterized protein n=1 Tax=Pelagimonas varians TaxID=696760 RepID=A0A238L5X2_9RHOB|nr:DUF6641 family protein [Pelagimonas varians]PYG25092.1 hypothetical protein C8N36_13514 [Pelagimonas varians]SMX50399.1 hypothetical protein PEV8663_04629 [Pelagimonas varians]